MERSRSSQSENHQTPEQQEQARREAFKAQRLSELNQEYESTLATFADSPFGEDDGKSRSGIEQAVARSFNTLSTKLSEIPDLEFGEAEQAILKLKLARHYQNHESVDLNTLADALIETPKFITSSKGSLHRLLEIHEEKTIQRIAEIRKRKAEQKEGDGFNPYEALFKTISGKYYLARLLNMPHLEEESAYMQHCVGTSDSYINKMKRGEVEILSLRRLADPGVRPRTKDDANKDVPVLTIEYNPKTGVIEQMKKANDEYLSPNDPFYADVIDALKQLPETATDADKPRVWSRINSSELESLPAVKDGHILTDIGEISWSDFIPSPEHIILKMGKIELTPQTPREELGKMLKVFVGLDLEPQYIARTKDEISPETRAYVGKLEPGIFDRLPDDLEYIYASFPDGKIRREQLETGGSTGPELSDLLKTSGMRTTEYSEFMLHSPEFTALPEPEEINLIRLKVRDFGFDSYATTEQLYKRAEELGLELCPAEVGPQYRLAHKDQPMNEWIYVGMKPITSQDGDPGVFYVARGPAGLWLGNDWARPDDEWGADDEFMFRLRKKT